MKEKKTKKSTQTFKLSTFYQTFFRFFLCQGCQRRTWAANWVRIQTEEQCDMCNRLRFDTLTCIATHSTRPQLVPLCASPSLHSAPNKPPFMCVNATSRHNKPQKHQTHQTHQTPQTFTNSLYSLHSPSFYGDTEHPSWHDGAAPNAASLVRLQP